MALWSKIKTGVYSESTEPQDDARKSAYVTHLREPVVSAAEREPASVVASVDDEQLVGMISAAVIKVRHAVRVRLRAVINGRVCEPSARGLRACCPPLCLDKVVQFVPRVYKSVDVALGKAASSSLKMHTAVTEAQLLVVARKALAEIDSCDLGCVICWQLSV